MSDSGRHWQDSKRAHPQQSETELVEARAEIARQRAIVEPLDRLRADEGHEVTFHHDNADDGPNCCVGVVGDWTEWEERLFYGDTVAACLKAAEEARAACGT